MNGISSRRSFLHSSCALALGLSGLQIVAQNDKRNFSSGYGSLKSDPNRILDLPEGFKYKIIGRAGDAMSDGLILPSKPDGMACFSGSHPKEVVVVRNHEVDPAAKSSEGAFGKGNINVSRIDPNLIYDSGKSSPCLGGTTTFVYNTKKQKLSRQFLSLAGTVRNCAGGPTPWNSWISCEETVIGKGGPCAMDHGWCFEVPVTEKAKLANPVPLKGMGRFNHEAVAINPDSGEVFLTEDRHEGLLYKFVPKQKGVLAKGGDLYALKICNVPSLDTRNWKSHKVSVGQELELEWLKMDEVDSPKDDLRFRGFHKGAACFARGEGMWYSNGAIYFACTNGGKKQYGQIWKLSKDMLQLFSEPNNSDLVDNCDNITVAPWGDLILCEDGGGRQYLDVITSTGKIFKFAKNAKSSGEFAGATFTPDGSTLFVNMQHDGLTLAITGPWDKQIG